MNKSFEAGAFYMADVRRKRPTDRRAVAVGVLFAGEVGFAAIAQRKLPKGDALVMAEVAGIQGAKSAATIMPLCHPLPLELVRVHCELVATRNAIKVYAEVGTVAKTGVEMEALAAVNAALLTIYDLTKPVEPALAIGEIRLLFKEGGKKGLWIHPDGLTDAENARFKPRGLASLKRASVAIIVLSDRASSGEYKDESGPVLAHALELLDADIHSQTVVADDAETLRASLGDLQSKNIRLAVLSGGTGLGPRDITSDVLIEMADQQISGIGELFRSASSHHTNLAWLSRAQAVMIGSMLVIALPGSPKAVAQGMQILSPILAHALAMIAGEGHP